MLLTNAEKRRNLKQMRAIFGGGALSFGLVSWLKFSMLWWWIPVSIGVAIIILVSCLLYEEEKDNEDSDIAFGVKQLRR